MTNKLHVWIVQAQPGFTYAMPIKIGYDNELEKVWNEERIKRYTFTTSGSVSEVTLDPEDWVLKMPSGPLLSLLALLDPLSGGNQSQSLGINSRAQTVGWSEETSSCGGPYMVGYSDIGCRGGSEHKGDDFPPCGDDEVVLTVDGGTLSTMHNNATYNCCADEIQVSWSLNGNVIDFTETEIASDPCRCNCCYDQIESALTDLAPDTYTVNYCWDDIETGQQQCHTEQIEIAGPQTTQSAFIWLPEPEYGMGQGTQSLADLLPSCVSSTAREVNDSGAVVGQLECDDGSIEPFLWLPEAAYGLDAGAHIPETPDSVACALGINGLGQVVGYTGDGNAREAVLWEYDEENQVWNMTYLATGYAPSEAWAINGLGQVVGWYTDGASTRAFVWGAENGLVELDEGEAYDINNGGDVVGVSAAGQAIVFDYSEQSGEWQSQPLPAGRSSSAAYAINDSGEIVGMETDGGSSSAVYWDMYGSFTDLNVYADGSDWDHLTCAWDINNAQQIVGYGKIDPGTGTLEDGAFILDLVANLIGACCLSGGDCVRTTGADCGDLSGTYEGDGTTCDEVDCTQSPTMGACCLPDGTCGEMSSEECESYCGTFRGERSACDRLDPPCSPSPTGACCLPDRTCIERDAAGCADLGGLFVGAGTTCAQTHCDQPIGACCIDDGQSIRCEVMAREQCAWDEGLYLGNFTDCAGDPCDSTLIGACCLPSGQCVEVNQAECNQLAGGFQGIGTTCLAIRCEPDGLPLP